MNVHIYTQSQMVRCATSMDLDCREIFGVKVCGIIISKYNVGAGRRLLEHVLGEQSLKHSCSLGPGRLCFLRLRSWD